MEELLARLAAMRAQAEENAKSGDPVVANKGRERLDILDAIAASGGDANGEKVADLEATLQRIETKYDDAITSLTSRVDALQAPDLSAINGRLDTLEKDNIAPDLSTINSRLDALEIEIKAD